MPSRRLHRAVATSIIGNDDGGLVDRLMDSTAATHGPRHREDPVHTIPGIAQELAVRGQLNPDRMARAMIHISVDRAWSDMWRKVPAPSRLKQPMKQLAEEMLATYLERRGGRGQ